MPSQLPLDLPHAASLARDDLIVSPSNRLAVEAVDAWPHWRHSVLVIVGPPGAGKTHLANVWAERAGARTAEAGALGAHLDEPGFRVVIDGLERLRLSETDLFGLVNAARLGTGSILATSRTPPAGMAFTLRDLRSRLCAATLAELGAPDDDLLTGVLVKLFADRQLDIAPRMVRYLAERMERSLDSARRIVAAVDREALASKERISTRLLKRVLDRESEAVRHQTVVPARYPVATED